MHRSTKSGHWPWPPGCPRRGARCATGRRRRDAGDAHAQDERQPGGLDRLLVGLGDHARVRNHSDVEQLAGGPSTRRLSNLLTGLMIRASTSWRIASSPPVAARSPARHRRGSGHPTGAPSARTSSAAGRFPTQDAATDLSARPGYRQRGQRRADVSREQRDGLRQEERHARWVLPALKHASCAAAEVWQATKTPYEIHHISHCIQCPSE